MRKRTLLALVAVLSVVGLLGGLTRMACGAADRAKLMAERAELKEEIARLNERTQDFQTLFEKSIELVMPSVVSITTTREVRRAMPEMPFELPPGFPQPRMRPEAPRQRTGLGSGFVVREDGYIVTNYHVVEDIEPGDIKVIFRDGSEHTPTKVFRDMNTEVAVLKLDADGLIPLEWGSSRDLKVGQWAIAIGSPLGLGNTVTAGIISATSTKDRFFMGGEAGDLGVIRRRTGYAIEDYIQTDAAINPGNSGGPLITLEGRVVGLNTLIISPSGSSAGLGFAVPEKIARPVVEVLVDEGRVVRGHLGVQILDVADLTDRAAQGQFDMGSAEEVLDEYNLEPDARGALVAGVLPGTPAEEAGLRVGDLITAVDDTSTPNTDVLRAVIARNRPGTEVTVTVRRKGREERIEVTLGEQPTEAQPVQVATAAALGMRVQTLTSELARRLGYDEDTEGVIVNAIERNSPAAQAGIEPMDVIQRVNRTPVKNVDQFRQAVAEAGEDGVALLIKRGDETFFRSVKP